MENLDEIAFACSIGSYDDIQIIQFEINYFPEGFKAFDSGAESDPA